MLYDMIWARLKPNHHLKLRPFTKANGRFNSIGEHFDRAVDVDTPQWKYDNQQ